MTKSELIDAVAQRTKITKSRAEQVVNCVFDSMTQAMEQSEGIEIRGFGSFSVREYPPYSGRNPRTGKPVHVAAKRLPFFKVGKELKELVNQPHENEPSDGSSAGRAPGATVSAGRDSDDDGDDQDDQDDEDDD